jgi:hypothetical protein
VSEGIPKNKVTGFRHPFLAHSKASYDAVFASGAEYESSGTLDPNTNGYWPFTLDNGMPFSPQPCTIGCAEIASTSYPGNFPDFTPSGKWLIPMYQILDENNVLYSTMDPILTVAADYEEAMKNYKHSFMLHRKTKLPFSLYVCSFF